MNCKNWKKVKLGNIGNVIGGGTPSTKIPEYYEGDISWITPKDLSNFKGKYISRGERMISETGLKNSSARMLPEGTVLFTSRAPIGYIAIAKNKISTNQGFKSIVPNRSLCNNEFLFYLLKYHCEDIKNIATGTTFLEVSGSALKNFEVNIPALGEQEKIANVLGSLDNKIELNEKINQNLEAQAQAIFKSWFVDRNNPERKVVKAEEIFDISIGKTPPRKETKWFSKGFGDICWISISDMGCCGAYISSSSEYLTKDAISKFNIKIVPDNTVILSFKLTVGRVAITDGMTTTNEAIAHFSTKNKSLTEYLYCYLKNYNFQSMGNTSSIATAINSKIIKNMPLVLPENGEVTKFHNATYPLFLKIKMNLRESNRLAQLRDALLPKLMSGEIDVSDVAV